MRKLFRLIRKLLAVFFLFTTFLVFIYKWIPVPITPLMVIRSMNQYNISKKFNINHDWKPLNEISKNLQLAVICSEDQHFLTHKGFDLIAIEKAIENNKKGKRIKGGSTISQQTAKKCVFMARSKLV